MSNISFDLSGKIDPDTVDVLREIKEVADSLNIAFFVVGATARDLILQHCYNVKPHRATMDVYIGVDVVDWNQSTNCQNLSLQRESLLMQKKRKGSYTTRDLLISSPLLL
jgi:predicted nucleotidyltransferase